MSSSVTTTSAATSSPTSSVPPDGDGNGGGGGGGTSMLLSSQASLYLYTFLVTLILLLSVSAAIVIRSYMLRRNQRRLMEEAIRNGTYVPPASPRGKKALGQKPKLSDVYLWPPGGQAGGEYEANSETWAGLMPVAASLVRPDPSTSKDSLQPAGETGVAAGDDIPSRRRRWLPSRLSLPWRRSRHQDAGILPTASAPPSNSVPPSNLAANTSSSLSASDDPSAEKSSETPPTRATVAVLIAMPVPPALRHQRGHRPQPSTSSSSDIKQPAISSTDEDLPYVEFGISEAFVAGW